MLCVHMLTGEHTQGFLLYYKAFITACIMRVLITLVPVLHGYLVRQSNQNIKISLIKLVPITNILSFITMSNYILFGQTPFRSVSHTLLSLYLMTYCKCGKINHKVKWKVLEI
jgi:hypothetical protein